MIICVEDDSSIRDLMIYTLGTAGFKAKGCADSKEFYQAVKEELPELVLLDIMLPGEDGLSILKKIRSGSDTKDIPVIMATAKGAEYDKVKGLDLGADDYLVKPFGMMEMVARVRAILRRTSSESAKSIISMGSITMDIDEHRVMSDGKAVELTLKEYDVLKLMMGSPGHVFSREQLLDIVWGIDYMGETRTVDVHIGTLRTKLGDAGKMIKTVRGIGYRMEAEQ